MSDMETHLIRQAAFSHATFGPGPRTKGVMDHIKKEFEEIETALDSGQIMEEWVDVAILGLDGLLRACKEFLGPAATFDAVAKLAASLIVAKQGKNELRNWPDWRTGSQDTAIEHVRGAHD